MDVIERTREIVQRFPRIAEALGTVHVDLTDPLPDSYGLSSVGDALLREDVLGNQTRQHSFLLYTVYSSMNDYERLHNSSALLELAHWLEEQTGAVVESLRGSGVITEIRAENGMLYDIPQEDGAAGVRYQLHIIVTYTVEKEDHYA